MKFDSNQFKILYLAALKEKLGPECSVVSLAVASQTLDEVVAAMTSSREAVVRELSTDGNYSHAVFGCFPEKS